MIQALELLQETGSKGKQEAMSLELQASTFTGFGAPEGAQDRTLRIGAGFETVRHGSFAGDGRANVGTDDNSSLTSPPAWANPDLIPQSAVDKVDEIELNYFRSWKRRARLAA